MSEYYQKTAIKLLVDEIAKLATPESGEAAGITTAVKLLKAGLLFLDQNEPQVTDLMSKQYMQEAAKAVEARLPDNHGFLLLVGQYGEGEGRTHYVSTMQRADAINLLKEFLIKAGAHEDWMKHIK